MGMYSTHNSVFDIYVLLGFGLVGYLMMLLKLEPVPLLLGLILGAPLEEKFRRAVLISKGDFGVFIDRPISATALAFVGLLAVWSIWSIWSFLRSRERTATVSSK